MIASLLLLLQAAAPAPAATVAPALAPWTPRERTNPATGQVVAVSATAIAKDGSSRLVAKCDRGVESVVSLQFFTQQPLAAPADTGSFDPKPVAVRFDNGPAIEFNWLFQSAAAYIPDVAPVTTLMAELAKAKTVTVRTTNAANFAFEATFAGPGNAAPIVKVLQACGYKLGEAPAPLPAKAPK